MCRWNEIQVEFESGLVQLLYNVNNPDSDPGSTPVRNCGTAARVILLWVVSQLLVFVVFFDVLAS